MSKGRISQETIDEVRAVSIVDVASRLGDNMKRVGTTYRVPCPNPNHFERTPDTYIKPSKNIFKCFGGGGCGAKGGDALSYYAWHEYGAWDPKQHFRDAVIGVAELMGIAIEYEEGSYSPKGNTSQKPKKKPRKAAPPRFQEIKSRSANDCDRIYRKFLEKCPIYEEHAKEWLGPKRQYTKKHVLNIGLRSVPSNLDEVFKIIRTLLDDGESLDRVPGFTRRLKKNGDPSEESHWYWTINVSKGYFIPVRDEKGRIVRLRVATGGKPKYIWFSSSPNVFEKDGEWVFDDPLMEKDKENNLFRMRRGGAPSGAPLNVVVHNALLDSWESGTSITDICKMDTVICTEGEHKSNISAERIKLPVIGVPGVGNYKDVLPLVKGWETKKLILAYDMDSLKSESKVEGKNQQVFDHLAEFAKQLMGSGIEVSLWTWNAEDGIGLDDLLLGKKLPIEIDLRTKKQKPVKIA
ncbi:hypothetical protein J2S74_002909 [Evansella vedderi]|uniref:Zinc finger CHC2-type domain-containing protein n=1 Tax=Evansella vedderi TaxID=38282 RepID=A0ABT9ZWB8_9BACI|nr:CHC2 zinc finger domain-containing protein [Evansella vedderi]MDQ0255527.1 hypothetical protein [Evansella vedderi]